MATARKTTSKTPAKAAPVTREELTQITKALTALTKEVNSLKAQLADAKNAPASSDEDLKERLRKWAKRQSTATGMRTLLEALDSKNI